MPEPLYYQTAVWVGGVALHCIETYDSLVQRLGDSEARFTEDSDERSGAVRWPHLIELTTRGDEGRPVRTAISPQAITMIAELDEVTNPLDERVVTE